MFKDLYMYFKQGQWRYKKLVYKYVVHSQEPQVLYEEQILKINADSFDEAYQKAEKYIESYIDKYTNINGDNVFRYNFSAGIA